MKVAIKNIKNVIQEAAVGNTWAMCILTVFALGSEFMFLGPLNNPAHFMLTMFTAILLGTFFGFASQRARINNMQALAKVRVSETKRLTHEIKRLENHF